jgi:hypothetical protein
VKNAIFWDVMPFGSCKKIDVLEECITSINRVTRIGNLGTTLAVTANIPSLPILVTLMMERICSSKTSVITNATQRNIPEDGILLSHHCENLKSYKTTKEFHKYSPSCNPENC